MILPLLGLVAAAFPADEGSIPLSTRIQREWTIELPAERFLPVSGALPCFGTPARFATELDGKHLRVDTDGDGVTDVRVEGDAGVVVLRGPADGGGEIAQAWRLRSGPAGWEYAAGSTRSGTLGATRLQLVDQDGDGRYDGYGTDALIVGSGEVASFLSRVVNVAGELYSLTVAPDGARIAYAPFEGARGTLDLASGLDTDGKLLSAIVRSSCGQHSFDLGQARAGLAVPAGSYTLHSGRIGLGDARVALRAGRSQPIEVTAEARVAPTWGGPLAAEFRYERAGAQLAISPEDVRYFGTLGEEYTSWSPRGQSPEFVVKEAKQGTELIKAIFPGSC